MKYFASFIITLLGVAGILANDWAFKNDIIEASQASIIFVCALIVTCIGIAIATIGGKTDEE